MARSTRSSTMSRPRSCVSTMARRRPASSRSGGIREGAAVGRRLDAEVLERERRQVDDAPRLAGKTDRKQGNLRVGSGERAVAATAQVAATGQVCEFDTGGGRDEQLAGVRIMESRPGQREGAVDPCLTVVGAEKNRVSLEERVRTAGGLDQRPDGGVAARQSLLGHARTGRVRSEVVIR